MWYGHPDYVAITWDSVGEEDCDMDWNKVCRCFASREKYRLHHVQAWGTHAVFLVNNFVNVALKSSQSTFGYVLFMSNLPSSKGRNKGLLSTILRPYIGFNFILYWSIITNYFLQSDLCMMVRGGWSKVDSSSLSWHLEINNRIHTHTHTTTGNSATS